VLNPCGAATWLITEPDPHDPDRLFGLCDLGFGTPKLGYLSRAEIEAVRRRFGLPLERDLWFTGDKLLSAYSEAARAEDRGATATEAAEGCRPELEFYTGSYNSPRGGGWARPKP
jgi:hypothetical protein